MYGIKIFSDMDPVRLEQKVNAWLGHPVLDDRSQIVHSVEEIKSHTCTVQEMLHHTSYTIVITYSYKRAQEGI